MRGKMRLARVVRNESYSGGSVFVGCEFRTPNMCCWVAEQRASKGGQVPM